MTSPNASGPRETELKLAVANGSVASCRRRLEAQLGTSAGPAQTLTSSYFDTRTHALRRRGLSLRVRDGAARRVQTLKADAAEAGGLFDRREWEADIAGDIPDPDGFEDPEARALLQGRSSLAPVFAVSVTRTTWIVTEGASVIEVVLDGGVIRAGDATAAVAEVELELKRGAVSDLFRLATRLGETADLRIAVQTKSERGYGLAQAQNPAPAKASPVDLHPDMTAGEAFQIVARACLRHFHLNESEILRDGSAEFVHQARVGLRRLRSALSLFRSFTSDPEGDRIRAKLRRLSAMLGEVRNLDVFLEGLPAEEPGDEDEPARAAFLERLRSDREGAYRRLVRMLRSKRFRLFTIELAAWIEVGPWLTSSNGDRGRDRRLGRFASRSLDRRWRKLRKASRRLRKLSPEERHRVRIGAKKLRYASEFFAGIAGTPKARRRHRRFVAILHELQESLGRLNDAATGREIETDLAMPWPGDPDRIGPADGGTVDRHEAEAASLQAAIRARRKLSDARPFWR